MNASTETKRRAAIYRAAAKEQDRNVRLPSCNAVGRRSPEEVKLYQRLMLNGETDVVKLWGAGREYCESTKRVRVLLLCFMAAMVEAGDA